MARQESITLIDDIDGGRADETVSFGLDGAKYEIDVNKKKATALRKVLAEFVSAARPVKPQRPAGPTTTKARRGATPQSWRSATSSDPSLGRRAGHCRARSRKGPRKRSSPVRFCARRLEDLFE